MMRRGLMAALLFAGSVGFPPMWEGSGHPGAADTLSGAAGSISALQANGTTCFGGYSGQYNSGHAAMSVSFRARITVPPGIRSLLYSRTSWSIDLQAANIRTYNLSNANNRTWSYPANPDEWHHYLVTYSGTSGFEMWIDGAAQTPLTDSGFPAPLATSAHFVVATIASGAFPSSPSLPGTFDLDELGYYNSELAGTDATEHWNNGAPFNLQNATNVPLYHWRFGEVPGDDATLAQDANATGIDLTLTDCSLLEL